MISLPFPPCWHKDCDAHESIDDEVVKDLLKIFQVFVVEYFGLSVVWCKESIACFVLNHFDLKFRSTSWCHSSHKIFRGLSPYQIVFSRKVKKNKIQSHWLTSKIWIVENIFSHYIFKKMCWRFCFDFKLFVPEFLTCLWWWKKEGFFLMPKKNKLVSKVCAQ